MYTSSDASVAGEPERPSYAASESGLNALMRHVASKWGKQGLTANCVSPVSVMTLETIVGERVPLEWVDYSTAQSRSTRLGKVGVIAAMVAMLLSGDGRWINGLVIPVNGGARLT